jgi:hypothetical protein
MISSRGVGIRDQIWSGWLAGLGGFRIKGGVLDWKMHKYSASHEIDAGSGTEVMLAKA